MSYSSEVLADSPILYPRLGESSQPAVSATSASSIFSSTFNAAKAFDLNATTSWTTASGSTGWLQVQYASGFVATRYGVAGRRDAAVNRSPKDWQFQGSNDGSTWTTLDTQSSVTTWASQNDMRIFSFTNSTSYSYYRLNVTANNGDALLNVTEFFVAGAYDASTGARAGLYVNGPTLGVTGALASSTNTAATFASASSQDVWFPWWSALDTTTFTLEAWVKTTATTAPIVGREGGTSAPYSLFVNASGALQLAIKNTGTGGVNYDGTATINDGAWHYVVGVRDNSTGEIWLYVDGVQDAHFTSTIAPQTLAGAGIRVASRGISPYLSGSVDEPALYATALSSTRVAAHYTAARTISGTFAATLPHPLTASFSGAYRDVGTFAATLPKVTASFTGTYAAPPSGTFSATLPAPLTASFAGTYTAPVNPAGSLAAILPVVTGSFTGDYHPHETGTLDATLPSPLTAAFSGTYTPGLETGTFAAALPSPLTADFAGTYTAGGDVGTLDAVLPLVVASFVGVYDGPVPTDTSNALDGRRRRGRGTATVDRPAASLPPGRSFGVRYDKAIAYPVPTMVEGRPT